VQLTFAYEFQTHVNEPVQQLKLSSEHDAFFVTSAYPPLLRPNHYTARL